MHYFRDIEWPATGIQRARDLLQWALSHHPTRMELHPHDNCISLMIIWLYVDDQLCINRNQAHGDNLIWIGMSFMSTKHVGAQARSSLPRPLFWAYLDSSLSSIDFSSCSRDPAAACGTHASNATATISICLPHVGISFIACQAAAIFVIQLGWGGDLFFKGKSKNQIKKSSRMENRMIKFYAPNGHQMPTWSETWKHA